MARESEAARPPRRADRAMAEAWARVMAELDADEAAAALAELIARRKTRERRRAWRAGVLADSTGKALAALGSAGIVGAAMACWKYLERWIEHR